ncbi:MAG: ATP-binding cassette domain-containing protein [Chitinivibrionales bacterium]|nr:ATP-binding cassette domain-containing protein [Chitinivibrionales bacterium]
MPAIEVQNLCKTFKVHQKQPGLRGSIRSLFRRAWTYKPALTDVSFTINQGEITGLVGANGAGKTTLIKILSGVIFRDRGTVSVLGYDPWERKNEFRSKIALIMGQKAQLWWDLPAADCFLLLREIYRIPKEEYHIRLENLATILDVSHLLTTQIRRLSLGERMKMELIAALLHNPSVIYLDEPTIGLDITSQRAVRNFLLEYNRRHSPAMIITSHYMEDIKSLCERLIIIRKGTIVYDGPLTHIVGEHVRYKIVTAHLPEGIRVSEIASSLPETIGRVVPGTDNILRVQVQRRYAVAAAQHILSSWDIADLAIEEEDISTIIESIQKDG